MFLCKSLIMRIKKNMGVSRLFKDLWVIVYLHLSAKFWSRNTLRLWRYTDKFCFTINKKSSIPEKFLIFAYLFLCKPLIKKIKKNQ